MKGIISIIEVMITGIILVLSFLYFFPQYKIKTEWDKVLLETMVKDTINTIERMNKTYEFATDSNAFNTIMRSLFNPEKTGMAIVWWKEVDGINVPEEKLPYFTEGYKETIVDVYNDTSGYHVYSFTLGLGYPY